MSAIPWEELVSIKSLAQWRENDEDAEQVIRIGQGDVNAINWLYDKYVGSVWGAAYAVLHQREDAEEVTQDVFQKVFLLETLAQFLSFLQQKGRKEYKGAFKSWLLRSTTNKAIDSLRKRHTSQRIDPYAFEQLADPGRTPEQEVMLLEMQLETSASVIAALESLKNKKEQYLAVAFHYGTDLSDKEIGEIIGDKTPQEVSQARQRGLTNLRKLLKRLPRR